MGVDDFETRKANREGFQRLMIRPRRLGPATITLDMSIVLFGRTVGLAASFDARSRDSRPSARRARVAQRRRLAREASCRCQPHHCWQSYEAIAEASAEPHWFQLLHGA